MSSSRTISTLGRALPGGPPAPPSPGRFPAAPPLAFPPPPPTPPLAVAPPEVPDAPPTPSAPPAELPPACVLPAIPVDADPSTFPPPLAPDVPELVPQALATTAARIQIRDQNASRPLMLAS